ncbi:hypothetical protein BvCmsB5655_03438 [Escherichia coli]|uniref:hypothetical protein n=1 Tax=Escherichia coli TaxID=562 RepID=UPI0010BACFAA|nr:hypothetical protein [Escherichia coli]GCJ80424.1 hypothetical protein BvCmsB5655_03438 [Escherichia coli]
MNLSSTIQYLSSNFEKIISRGGMIVHPETEEMYIIGFDKKSYDQVLVISKLESYNEVVQFCCTEFGIYIKDAETNTISHYFYHTLMGTKDFGLKFDDLVQCHYMFKTFPASGH